MSIPSSSALVETTTLTAPRAARLDLAPQSRQVAAAVAADLVRLEPERGAASFR
jgi:hypothetical protein